MDCEVGKLQPREILVPLMPLARLRGIVLGIAEVPLAGATIDIVPRLPFLAPRPAPTDVKTGADGRFDVPLGVGSYDVTARSGALHRTRTASLERGGEAELELRLATPFHIRGTLVRAAPDGDAPVTKASVSFWPDPGELTDDELIERKGAAPTVSVDSAGGFELALDRFTHGVLLVSHCPLGMLAEPVRVVLDSSHPQPEVALRLAPAASIAGRVVDEHGAPCAPASVSADAGPASRTEVARKEPGRSDLWGSAKAVADDDGRFSVGPLHPQGVYVLTASYGPKDRRDLLTARDVITMPDVPAGTTDVLLASDARSKAVGRFSLLVRSAADGRPVAKFITRCARRERDGGWSEPEFKTWRDERGLAEFLWIPRDAHCGLVVEAVGFGRVLLPEVVPTEEDDPIAVMLPATGALDVQVRKADAPAAYAFFSGTRMASAFETALAFGRATIGRVDEDGARHITDLEPGTWSFSVSLGGATERRTVDVTAGGSARLEVELP
jgi:hypothetical protein